MPIRVGDSSRATGWTTVPSIRTTDGELPSVRVGDVEVWRKAMAWEQDGQSKTITTPTWANYIDIVALGGGSGGVCGNGGNTQAGRGGDPGKFAATCWATVPGRSFVISIGEGGAGGVGGNIDGKPGGPTTVTHGDLGYVLTAEGGPRVSGQNNANTGYGPGSYTYKTPAAGPYIDSTVQSGGGDVGMDQAGSWPGGGGGGGAGGVFGKYSNGQPGAQGAVWYRFRAY